MNKNLRNEAIRMMEESGVKNCDQLLHIMAETIRQEQRQVLEVAAEEIKEYK